MWADLSQYRYLGGDLYLGRDPETNEEIGIETERHAITIAGAGAGKGACVIIPNLERWPHNALVIDPKGEAAEATAEKREAMGQAVHVIDPFRSAQVDERFQASYNPLAALDLNSMTIKEDIEAISDGIVMRHDPQAAHWDDGAQAIISGLIAYVKLALPEDKQNLIEVRAILRNVDRFDSVAAEMKKLTGCSGVCEAGASAIHAQEGGYFTSNAEKNTRWLDSEGMKNVLQESTFSLSDIKRGKASVYLVLPANYLGQHGRFLRLFIRCAIEEMARKMPDGNLRGAQCLFLLDEFYSLGYISEIAKAAGLMRGYGLQLWPILQDLGQLISLYKREGSETFFGNSDLHQFFGNTDKFTLDYMAQLTGDVSIDEIGLPPEAPIISGGGQGVLSSMTAHSKDTSTRVMGSALDAIGGGISQAIDAAASKKHQDKMAIYQQKMATVGRPRIPSEEIAQLVRRKDDVVANAMFCAVFGSEKLLVKPIPYFRNDEIEQAKQAAALATSNQKTWHWSDYPKINGIAAGILVGLLIGTQATNSSQDTTISIIAIIFSFIVWSVSAMVKGTRERKHFQKTGRSIKPTNFIEKYGGPVDRWIARKLTKKK